MTKARRRPTQSEPLGILAQTYVEAIRLMDAQRDQGVSRVERFAGLEQTIRAAWPHPRAWHPLCATCDDTGWAEARCTPPARCQRPFRLPASTNRTGLPDYTGQGQCGDEHWYVRSCPICPKGEAFGRPLRGESGSGGGMT